MYFHVDHDGGSFITGWVVADNPGDVPELIIRIPNRKEIAFSANVFRADLRDLGMHSTGQAGFLVDDRYVPDLAEVPEVTLIESDSGVTIYKRFDPQRHLPQKFLFIDASVFPQIKLIRSVMSFFTQSYPLAQRLSLETITGLLSLTNIKSIFICGSPSWQRHGDLAVERGFFTAALLRDPFEELAEKILFLTHSLTQPEGVRASPAIERFEPLLPYLQGLKLDDSKEVLSAVRRMPPPVKALIKSPMTATFGAAPDEIVQRRSVSAALDNLAKISVVGLRSRYDLFTSMVDDYLGAPVLAYSELNSLPGVHDLAKRLSDIGIVADLLDEDIALYSFVEEAVVAGLKKEAS
ncbi:hypothetical protein C6558_37935 [Ensifer sp. NM-2]|uniref:hypothetical protein n=1 Tax=Ensifer sp. NM-2 TaxID=2109730 RepID=UPI000D125C2D|nr:hypothetical protein [Ensifer sp. NM-2]PSS59515.1 hypothetical protein C6558_37935 [Ensifer sp. NM-2]